jgi:rhodanese-related sulfurtransferase
VNEKFLEEAKKALPDPDAEIVVSCQMGRRGALATKELQNSNYSKIYNLAGGLAAWTEAGYPTEQ